MLDKLPAWARHLLIVIGSSALGSVVGDVVAAHGVTEVDWLAAARDALDFAAFSGASAAAALWGLPLTRQYGVGAKSDGPNGAV